MSTIWYWRTFDVEPFDVTGWDVEATDGHIGKVDAATYDEGTSCLVVDTGFWIFGHKRMLPAGLVDAIDAESQTLYLSCTKDEVKSAPDYDDVRRDEEAYREGLADYWSSRV